MGDTDREKGTGDKFFTYLLLYLVVSVLALFVTAFITIIINDKNSFFYTFLEPLTIYNLVCIGPWALMLAIVLGVMKMKDWMTKKVEATKAKRAEPPTQKTIDPPIVSKPRARDTSISKAEEDLDIWTLIVQLKDQDASVRIEAARKLRNHNTPAAEEELTKAMLEDSDLNVRFEAYLALKFQGKDKIDILLDQLKIAGNTKAKMALLDLLRMTGDEKQASTLTYLYDFETDKAVKLGILNALEKFNSLEARNLAISIIHKEDDTDIRQKALEVLRWYDDSYSQNVNTYRQGNL